jgi:peptidoglycan/LPS O-acetylase OafA/YrhL
MSHPISPAYRPDIDGLRAVAVLAVVAHHLFPTAVPAGFVGVDLFFVISGFLITRIVLDEADQGRFSLAGFYARRARRLFPALTVVLIACLAAGWWVLYFTEYRQLGSHAAFAAVFAVNLVLWSETGYFDAEAATKPLLHLWSLAVEEQFYLLWPLVVAGLIRRARPRRGLTLVLLAASFVAGLFALQRSPAAAFYLPVFRFWELMAGALLAQCRHAPAGAWSANGRAIAGALLLGLSAIVIDPAVPFPGWRAVLPVAAVALLISAGARAGLNRWLLASPPLVGIGRVSYPLYLWHWPLLSFYKILGNDALVTGARGAALFAIALGLAVATHWLLERPLRGGAWGRTKAVALTGLLAAVGIAGMTVFREHGWPARPVNDRDPTFSSRDGRNATDVRAWLVEDCELPPEQARLFRLCTRDARAQPRYALTGDSKADALFAGLVRTSTTRGRWMYLGGNTGRTSVLPVLSPAGHYAVYQDPVRVSLAEFKKRPTLETVVVFSATRAFFHLATASSIEDLPASPFYGDAHEGLVAYVDELVTAGKRVVLVADHPTLPDPKRCMRDARVAMKGPLPAFFAVGQPDPRCSITIARHRQLAAQYLHLLDSVAGRYPGRVFVFDTLPHVCDVAAGVCSAEAGGELLYSFSDHVSDHAATRIGAALNVFLAGLDRRAPPARQGIRSAP